MTRVSDPTGLHRVMSPAGVLPQAAGQLDTSPELSPDEFRLNLDAVSFRQLVDKHGGDGDAVRAEVGAHANIGLQVGDQVTTLVSLTVTPLVITDDLIPPTSIS